MNRNRFAPPVMSTVMSPLMMSLALMGCGAVPSCAVALALPHELRDTHSGVVAAAATAPPIEEGLR